MTVFFPALVLAALPPVAVPQDCLWEEAALAPQARVEAQSVVHDGKLYLFGGFWDVSLHATPRTDVYDPQTDSWSRLADMLTTVTHHTAALDGDTVWIVAGFLGDNGGPVMPSVQRYHIPTDTWTFGPSLPERRASGALVRLGRKLHYFGGFSTRQLSAAEHFVLDLDNTSAGWDTTSYAPLPVARGHLSAAVLDGDIYAIGGQIGHDVNPIDLPNVDRYDAATNTWVPVQDMPYPRSHVEASTFAYGGQIILCGGRNNQPGGAASLESVIAYDPILDAWSEQAPLPVGLLAPSAKPIGTTLHVMTGASNGVQPVDLHHERNVMGGVRPVTRLNSGGAELSSSEVWCEDLFYVGGQSYTALGTPQIAGTTDDELFWTERSGTVAEPNAFDYLIPVANGDYRITLHFAEVFWTNPGERVFDVTLEGLKHLEDFDIVAEVGALRSVEKVLDVEVTDGEITLEFRSTVDRPKLSGLEIERMDDDFINVYCAGAPNSTGGGARLRYLGSTSRAAADMAFIVTGLPPGKLAYFGVSPNQLSFPYGSGTVCLGSPLMLSAPMPIDSSGEVIGVVPPDLMGLAGSRWNFQAAYLDDAPFLINFTDALEVQFTD